jgi:F-type H+-transporting ATPase subunit epsilon
MRLKILLPFQIFVDEEHVSRIVVQTPDGSLGLLPNRRDCVTALTAGVLFYEADGRGEVYVAVDEGVLVKTGPEVLVSVARAIAGNNLNELRGAVEREFSTQSEDERSARSVMAKLEAGFLHRIGALQRD